MFLNVQQHLLLQSINNINKVWCFFPIKFHQKINFFPLIIISLDDFVLFENPCKYPYLRDFKIEQHLARHLYIITAVSVFQIQLPLYAVK